MFSDFFKALGQFGDRRFNRVLFLGIGLSFGLLFAITALLVFVVGWFTPDQITLPIVQWQITWISNVLSLAMIPLMLGLSVFLMVPVASAFTSIFLDEVADAVEEEHYPHLPQRPRAGFSEALFDSLVFLGVIVGANILALVVYFLIPPLAPFVFYLMNGFLLGREYFTLVAMRRLGREGAKRARSRHSFEIWMAGTLMALPLSIPVVNLLIPVLGAATFTHFFHRVSVQE